MTTTADPGSSGSSDDPSPDQPRPPAAGGLPLSEHDAPVSGPALTTLGPGEMRRLLIKGTARVLALTVFLVVAYFEVPIGADSTVASLAIFAVGLVGFVALLVYQIRRIVDAPMPQLRGAETLGTVLPLFLVLFALVYVSMAQANPANFSQPMTRMAGLYFTTTVLSTVGFGDITPTTDFARAVVTIQMVLDLILIGLVVKVVMGASRLGVERRRAEAASAARAAGAGEPGRADERDDRT